MELWHAYIDESYDSKTFCVGGFLARADEWVKIERAWKHVVAGENVRSAKKGFPPISRYHATDCAGLKREFKPENGWNINRQIRLTQRICELVRIHQMAGIVIGGSIADVNKHVELGRDIPKEFLYSTCMKMCLMEIAGTVREVSVDPQVKVFYDRSDFGKLATEAFQMLRRDANPVYKSIVSMEPTGWEDSTALQPADFMAYEGFREIGTSLKGSEHARKSLQALVGTKNEIVIAYFQEQNFADLMKMIENQRAGLPLAEGVNSGLTARHGYLPYIPGIAPSPSYLLRY